MFKAWMIPLPTVFMTRKGLFAVDQSWDLWGMSDHPFSPGLPSPYQVVLDHCEAADLKMRAEHDLKGVFFSMRGELAIYDVALLITHDDEVLQIYITYPVATNDEKLQPIISEFVTRANSRMVIGHFEYDMEGGKLRFHVGHAFGERGLDDESIGRLMATAMDTADRYFPALMRALIGGETPADAIYLAELDYHAEAEAIKQAEAQRTPPTTAPTSLPKRRQHRPRSNPKATGELPGLFDEQPSKDGRDSDSPSQR